MADEGGYKISIKGPGLAFDRPVDEAAANKIISFVMIGGVLPQGNGHGSAGGLGAANVNNAGSANISNLNPKQFIAQKKPNTQYERIACIAYYLTHVRNVTQFVTEDITALNTEAAQAQILNAPQIVRDTDQKYRYLTGAGDRNKQITVLGEAVVEALPDREAVKAAIAENRSAKPKKKRRAAKKTK